MRRRFVSVSATSVGVGGPVHSTENLDRDDGTQGSRITGTLGYVVDPLRGTGHFFEARRLARRCDRLVCRRKRRSGSISRVLYAANRRAKVISLGHALLHVSSSLPGSGCGSGRSAAAFAALFPVWPCSKWGLPSSQVTLAAGALLPHLFTLTGIEAGGMLSVALSLALRPVGVTDHFHPGEPGLSSRGTAYDPASDPPTHSLPYRNHRRHRLPMEVPACRKGRCRVGLLGGKASFAQ